MKKIMVAATLLCGFAFSATAQNVATVEEELQQKIENLQMELANERANTFDARVSVGYIESCRSQIETISTTPGSPSWQIAIDSSTGKGQVVFWRYNCGGTNVMVATVSPSSTKGVFACPSVETVTVQNGVQGSLGTYTTSLQTCGTFYVPTSLPMYDSAKKVDIDAAFKLIYDKKTIVDIPAASGSGGAAAVSNPSGLWYDPAMDGAGFNLIHAANGVFVYYYGYTASGQRLWLVSEPGPTSVTQGQSYTLNLSEGKPGNGANFTTKPTSGNGVAKWGTLTMKFTSCTAGEFTLTGADGTKTFAITKLGNINGLTCQ